MCANRVSWTVSTSAVPMQAEPGAGRCVGGATDHERQATLGQMNHGGVEVGALVKGRCNHRGGKRRRGLEENMSAIASSAGAVRGAVSAPVEQLRISWGTSLHRRTKPTASSSAGRRRK